jgi:type I restriction enzyme S subunit
MELTEGFKQTDLGVLPEDWDIRPLGKCLSKPPDYGINAPAVPYSSKLPTYIRITDISEDGQFAPSERVSVQSPMAHAYYLEHGDLVLARTGNTVGKSYRYKAEDGRLVFAGFLIRIQPNANVLLPTFLSSYLATGAYWRWVRQMSMRSGQPGINGQEYAQLPVPVPPVEEQQAIAGALGDVDALLDRLDQLIAKKRDLRIAVMQQLLSGETRLPGHMKPWTEARLGELGTFFKGSGVRKSEANSGALPCVRYGELYTHHDNVVRRFFSSISPQVAATATRLERGDLLFAGSGETKEEIGKCAAFAGDFLAYAGGDIVVLRNHRQNPTFMGYYCNSPVVGRQKASKGQGDAVVHISARALADISVRLPSVPEQDAIAEVLEDSDAEISTLEERRAKTQDLKLAMMQELLTGKTQLHTTGGSNG